MARVAGAGSDAGSGSGSGSGAGADAGADAGSDVVDCGAGASVSTCCCAGDEHDFFCLFVKDEVPLFWASISLSHSPQAKKSFHELLIPSGTKIQKLRSTCS